MPLLTELGQYFRLRYYKYAAPTVLPDAAPVPAPSARHRCRNRIPNQSRPSPVRGGIVRRSFPGHGPKMPLLTELWNRFCFWCYKYAAPTVLPAAAPNPQRQRREIVVETGSQTNPTPAPEARNSCRTPIPIETPAPSGAAYPAQISRRY